MNDYTAWNANVKSWRRKLRTAKTKANNVEMKANGHGGTTPLYRDAVRKVREVVEASYADWDEKGMPYPDGWHEWERALDDAHMSLIHDRPTHF